MVGFTPSAWVFPWQNPFFLLVTFLSMRAKWNRAGPLFGAMSINRFCKEGSWIYDRFCTDLVMSASTSSREWIVFVVMEGTWLWSVLQRCWFFVWYLYHVWLLWFGQVVPVFPWMAVPVRSGNPAGQVLIGWQTQLLLPISRLHQGPVVSLVNLQRLISIVIWMPVLLFVMRTLKLPVE